MKNYLRYNQDYTIDYKQNTFYLYFDFINRYRTQN